MKDPFYIKAVEELLKETEGKLQDAMKNKADKNVIGQMQDVINYLRKELKKALNE